jgi:hypothetical protein
MEERPLRVTHCEELCHKCLHCATVPIRDERKRLTDHSQNIRSETVDALRHEPVVNHQLRNNHKNTSSDHPRKLTQNIKTYKCSTNTFPNRDYCYDYGLGLRQRWLSWYWVDGRKVVGRGEFLFTVI